MWTLLVVGSAGAADLAVGVAQPFQTVADALAAASSGDRILVDPGAYVEDELLLDAGLVIEIRAVGGPGTVVLRGTGPALLDVQDLAEVTLADVEFDGEGARRLGVVTNDGRLRIVGCDVHDTAVGGMGSGGALFVSDGILELDTSTFAASSASRDGGFVALSGGSVGITSSTFTGGVADGDGGAIASDGADVAISASLFTGGAAGDDGGAVDVIDADLVVTGSTFSANVAVGDGAIHCLRAGVCAALESTFDGNVAATGSAAAFEDSASAGLLRAVVCASGGTASVSFVGTIGTVANSVVLGNAPDQHAVFVDAGADVDLTNNSFASNVTDGVGAAVRNEGLATFTNNFVAWNDGPTVALSTSLFAASDGGYQAYWQNVLADTDTALAGDLVGVDPLIAEPPAGSCEPDLLAPPRSSPLVDAGDPVILDGDGSPSDIGAWGGPDARPLPPDGDGDGFYAPQDCDDGNAAIRPFQPEVTCNGLDDDCLAATPDDVDADADGTSVCAGDCDDEDPAAIDLVQRYTDADGDTYGTGALFTVCGDPPGTSPIDGDCDDADPDSFPGAEEVAYDGIDQDCDGIDLDDLDADGVLYADDCDDLDPERAPDLADDPDDGVDQDCTGQDATARLKGAAGVQCGCSTGSAGTPLLGVALLLARRRR